MRRPADILRGFITRSLCGLIAIVCLGACDTVVENRIPAMPVSIDLTNVGVWSTYGVSGIGDYNYFVNISGEERLPAGFPYKVNSATGYGGVLLIEGMDPFTLETMTPLAYDLACPVERNRSVRVYIDENLEAVCPVCDSHYNVLTAGGAPTAGQALTGEKKYGLQRYVCSPSSYGGYYITDNR